MNKYSSKEFQVTFTEKKRYNPMTRTVTVFAKTEEIAIRVLSSVFDSLYHTKYGTIPSGKHIKIDEVVEVSI